MDRRSETKVLASLAALFFLHGMAMGAWFVPLGPVLKAHGLESITALAFATSAVAALISPLFFAALADRSIGATRVLGGLSLATALMMGGVAFAIRQGAAPWVVLLLIQLQSLCMSPTWGLANATVFGGMRDALRQFGPIRAVATIGWMAGCWTVSALGADQSTFALLISAVLWLCVAVVCMVWVPSQIPVPSTQLTLRERFGLDAFALLRNPQHRVVLLTTALFAVPLAAFYPFTPIHLQQIGLEHTAAWMSLGQVTEVAALLSLPLVLQRMRLKTILTIGLCFGLLRYLLYAADTRASVIAGLTLHGVAFTLFFITVQIYLDQCIEPTWKSRAQSLYSLMLSGLGNLFGYVGTGMWFAAATPDGATDWTLFWGVLAGVVAAVLVYFVTTYRSRPE